MTGDRELDRAVARVERAMDEAYSRYASATAAERSAGVTAALQHTVQMLPPALRRKCLEVLADLHLPEVSPTADRHLAEENAELRAEIEQRRAEQERMRSNLSSDAILEALLPPESGCTADAVDPAVLARVVGALAKFAADLARAFSSEADARGVGRQEPSPLWRNMHASLSDETGNPLNDLLEEVKCKVGAELKAFEQAAKEGAQYLLAQLDPLLIESEADSEGRRQLLDLQMFRFRRLWEAFQRKHAQLSQDEDLYEEYFAGHLRAARFYHRQNCGKKRHA